MSLPKSSPVAILALSVMISGAVGCSSVPRAPMSLAQQPTSENPSTASPTTPVVPAVPVAAPTRLHAPAAIAQVGFRHSTPAACAACQDGVPQQPCGACAPSPMLLPPPWRVDPQEFLCDGGDRDPHAFLSRNDQIRNLQAEDTVTHYTTEGGDIEFAASNRVCVYSPRFGSVRQITGAVAGEKAVAVVGLDRREGPVGINLDLPGLVVRDNVAPINEQRNQRLDSMRDRNRGVIVDRVQQPNQAVDFLAALAGIQNVGLNSLNESQLALVREHALAAIAWSIDESVEVEILDLKPPVLTRDQKLDSLVVYDFPDAGRLNLIKLVDKPHAKLGDTVTFFLRLQNVGDSAVSGVRVTDNLTTRLEFVPDSSKVMDPKTGDEIDASVDVLPNSGGSSKLLWTLPGELAVGEMVEITFQCVIR